MKRIGLILMAILLVAFPLFSQNVNIPDANFLNALIDEGVDTNGDSLISYEEAEAVVTLAVGGDFDSPGTITDMTGIEAFVNLGTLECSWNQLTSLDVSSNTALDVLNCGGNQLTSLDLSNNPELTYLNCCCSQLTSLDVSSNTALVSLRCNYNQLASLDVSSNTALEVLSCGDNQLTSLDVSNNTALRKLYCSDNQLTSLNLSNTDALTFLDCSNSRLPSLDVSSNTMLTSLRCYSNQLTELDVSSNTMLTSLRCYSNQLTELDVTNNTALTRMEFGNNQLTSLDVSNNTNISHLQCDGNQLTYLDITKNKIIHSVRISEMPSLIELCVWEMPFPPSKVYIDTTNSPNVYFTTECLYAENVFIPDTAFLNALIEVGVDTNGDSLINYIEARATTILVITVADDRTKSTANVVRDVTGIEAFIHLNTLILDGSDISNLDLSFNTRLKHVSANSNLLQSIDVSKCLELDTLEVGKAGNYHTDNENQLTDLDVSNNTALIYLDCDQNQLTSLNLSNNDSIRKLNISNMPSLNEVCVWTIPFPPLGVTVDTTGSTDVEFKDCVAPELLVPSGPLNDPAYIPARSSEDGMIYLVPADTERDLNSILEFCFDSVNAIADVNVKIDRSDLGFQNIIYWLYARDESGNISESKAISITGVGLKDLLADHFRIFPNPATNILTIETEHPDNNSIEITSLNGQLIYNKEMEGTSYQIDLSSFQKGVYFIKIRSKDFITTRKIIKL